MNVTINFAGNIGPRVFKAAREAELLSKHHVFRIVDADGTVAYFPAIHVLSVYVA